MFHHPVTYQLTPPTLTLGIVLVLVRRESSSHLWTRHTTYKCLSTVAYISPAYAPSKITFLHVMLSVDCLSASLEASSEGRLRESVEKGQLF